MKESTMQRMYRQLADQWEWYANCLGRNDPKFRASCLKNAREARAKLESLKERK